MPAFPTPALDLILNLADKSAVGRLTLSVSRVVASLASGSATYRIVRADTGRASVRACLPNLSGDRAFDDVDLSTSTVRIALGKPGENPYCLATLATPFPVAAAQITTAQSATVDLPATKRITLDPAPYAGTWLLTLDNNDPFEIPWDAEQGQIKSLTGTAYTVKKIAANAWEISGTEPNQDVTISVDVTGLLVPIGVTGDIALNTVALAAAFDAAGDPRWLRLTLEVDIDGVKVYQNDQIEIARELLNLTALVPTPIPPSDFATLSAALAAKQPISATLTQLAGLTTTAAGRALLTQVDQAGILAYLSGQPLSAQLTAIAALAGAVYGRLLLTASTAASARGMLVLDHVDNTADVDKPVSTAQATGDQVVADAAALALTTHQNRTDNPHAVTKAQVGLGNVDNTSDANKPVSTAAAAALTTHQNRTDNPHAVTKAQVGLGNVDNTADVDKPVSTAAALALTTHQNRTDNPHAVTKAQVGLGNVDNTSDANKPVSTAAAAALTTHQNRTDNPHAVTKAQVGLANADNTSDAAKSVSAAQQAALDTKVGKTGNENIAGEKNFTSPASFYSLVSNSVVSNVLATPGAPVVSPVGSDEGATWSYKIVARLSDGSQTAASLAGTTAHGDQTLDATNRIVLTWDAVPGAVSYDVYRTAVALSPATIGKIANVTTNAYTDTGAAGDASTPPDTNTTGKVSGFVWDKGGQFYHIMAYGGVTGYSDGTANDAALAAIQAEVGADTGKAPISLPGQLVCFASDIVLASNKSLIGFGSYYTEIKFLGSASLVLGTSAHYFNGRIQGLTVSRNIDFPNIPSGSTGIKAFYYQGAAIDDVMIATHDIGIKAGGNSSTQLTISNTTIFNIKSRSLWLQDAIQTNLFFVQFGRTGILNSPAIAVITIGGISDTVFAYGLFIGGSDGAGILWENSVGSSGVFFFDHITAEAIVGPFLSCDSATTEIKLLQLVNSRAQTNGKMFDFASTTVLDRFDISHNIQLQSFTSCTLRNLNNCTFSANKVDGDLTFDAGGFGTAKIIGNTFTTSPTVTGAWKALNFDGNQFTYNGVTEINLIWTVTGPPGSISRVNNVKDTGTPIPNIFPADTLQPDWVAATLPSSDGWINFGGSPRVAGYRKNRAGDVEIRGVVKNGSNTGGALLMPLLPVGYRPSDTEYFPAAGAGGPIVRVESSGAVRLDTPGTSNGFLSLSGIRFTPA